jgi:hypothetical protein
MAIIDSAILYNLADTLGLVIAYNRSTQVIENKSKPQEVDLGGVAIRLGMTIVCYSTTKNRIDALCKVKGNLFLLASCEKQPDQLRQDGVHVQGLCRQPRRPRSAFQGTRQGCRRHLQPAEADQ